jgi:uncharacterized repeat protein (TIGR03803 family)
MQRNRVLALLGKMLAVAGVVAALAPISSAESKESVLHTFTFHADGGFPFAGLTSDAKGNLYGVSDFGGDLNEGICCGVVFQLTPDNSGGWAFKVIYTFTGPITGGEAPTGSVVFDASGNLYGTTQIGGFCGTAYELSPTEKGEWKQTTLHYFNDVEKGVTDDGCLPSSFLIFDPAGNLYGTTQQTGASDCMTSAGCGTVFELSPQADGKWKESVIHHFPANSADGVSPYGGLVMDSAGNLWGTTQFGGTAGEGTVFELRPGAGGEWNEQVASNFTGDNGDLPMAGMAIDAAGNLYGTTYFGGVNGAGIVFKMTPQPGGQLSETVIHEFAECTATECPDGFGPFGGLLFDTPGNLYGTTTLGGGASSVCDQDSTIKVGCGVVFKLTPGPDGSWKYSIVYRFPGDANGGYPTDDHLAVDLSGNIFGTTFVEGDVNNNSICPQEVFGLGGCGVVFEVTP